MSTLNNTVRFPISFLFALTTVCAQDPVVTEPPAEPNRPGASVSVLEEANMTHEQVRIASNDFQKELARVKIAFDGVYKAGASLEKKLSEGLAGDVYESSMQHVLRGARDALEQLDLRCSTLHTHVSKFLDETMSTRMLAEGELRSLDPTRDAKRIETLTAKLDKLQAKEVELRQQADELAEESAKIRKHIAWIPVKLDWDRILDEQIQLASAMTEELKQVNEQLQGLNVNLDSLFSEG